MATESAARRRVLIACENVDARLRVLNSAYDVHAFDDGEAALASARESPPDLVLADVMMHRPLERELRVTDLYARQAAEMIERKQAEEALRASEERFRRYFDLGLIGMAITSPEKGCVEVNDELCRILGFERDRPSAASSRARCRNSRAYNRYG